MLRQKPLHLRTQGLLRTANSTPAAAVNLVLVCYNLQLQVQQRIIHWEPVQRLASMDRSEDPSKMGPPPSTSAHTCQAHQGSCTALCCSDAKQLVPFVSALLRWSADSPELLSSARPCLQKALQRVALQLLPLPSFRQKKEQSVG